MKFKDTDRIDQVDEVLSIQSDHTQYRKKFTLALRVNQVKIVFELDSGAAVTLLNLKNFKKYF